MVLRSKKCNDLQGRIEEKKEWERMRSDKEII
jgi:hypothetical protein